MSKQPWLKRHPHAITLAIKVKPSSKQNGVVLDPLGVLIVLLQAAPQEGQANKMLIKYLAKLLKMNQKDIVIARGAESRNKLIRIEATDIEQHKIVELLTNINGI